jgi:hypothetical protein
MGEPPDMREFCGVGRMESEIELRKLFEDLPFFVGREGLKGRLKILPRRGG